MPIQLNAEDDTAGQSGGDSFKIVNNIVNHCGGHNCLQVHYDTGAPLVQGNRVGPGCVHNCIDTKGVGNGLTSPAPLVGKILGNYVTCPGCSNSTAAYYTENNYNPSEQITYQNNIAYHAPIAFQAETGGPAPRLHARSTRNITTTPLTSSASSPLSIRAAPTIRWISRRTSSIPALSTFRPEAARW